MAFREFMTEFGCPQKRASPVYCDSAGTILKTSSGKSDKRSLYMRKRTTFVKYAQFNAEVALLKVRTDDNRADILTKILQATHYARLRDMILNVKNIAANIHAFVQWQIP